ncbi:hypothetical protein JTE90_006407 [Oedothorax gibbosus]|uniref:RRM domain-containing protein n=1 Tax=Oedothorax gibbosus TaxID=931172 RepID=A0AAV6VXQ7_9ARAC|nr:hypothetical protein JTE90_006407 [Oedothorax gibbosus]
MHKNTRKWKDYGFESFHFEDAKEALERLNGLEVAGRSMKIDRATKQPTWAEGHRSLEATTGRARHCPGSHWKDTAHGKAFEGLDLNISAAAVPALQMYQGFVTSKQVNKSNSHSNLLSLQHV